MDKKPAELAADAAEVVDVDTIEPLAYPEDITGLSDDELAAAIDECRERSEMLVDAKDIDTADAVALIENALDVADKLDAEHTRREEAAAEAEQALADAKERLAKRLNPAAEDDEADADADDDEDITADAETDDDDTSDAPVAPAKVLVEAAAKPVRRHARAKQHEPTGVQQAGARLLALKDMPGEFTAGESIDLRRAAHLVSEAWNRSHGVDGPRTDMPLLRFALDTPSDRVLDDNEIENWQKIQRVVDPYGEAMIASGGVCAPPEPFYDLQTLSTDMTPVVDSIPRFNAARGGIRWMTPATLASVTTGVGTITNANDTLGGTNATKTCQTLPCPAQNTAFIDAIYHCLSQGNMGARTWPEFTEHFTKLTMAAFARVRETKALDALVTGSTAVTQASFGGFANTLLGGVLQAAEAMRSVNRMPDTAVLRAWFPAWTRGAMAEDLIRQQFGRFDVLDGGYKAVVEKYLRSLGIAPTFYVDGPTNGSQVFSAESGSTPLNSFPATCKWFLAPEGTWIRLDGGTLDLGIVRDSVLNATNDFQMFGEVFETYAKVGTTSLYITTDVCPNGQVTAPVTEPCGS